MSYIEHCNAWLIDTIPSIEDLPTASKSNKTKYFSYD